MGVDRPVDAHSLKFMELGEEEGAGFWLHRHQGVHRPGVEGCWCHPVWIDETWQLARSRAEIEAWLKQFFKVQ